MIQTEIKILGRVIPVSCRDGEQNRVQNLAKKLDDTLVNMKQKLPTANDVTILVLNSLILMDGIEDKHSQNGVTDQVQNGVTDQAQNGVTDQAQNDTNTVSIECDTLESMFTNLEKIAVTLEQCRDSISTQK